MKRFIRLISLTLALVMAMAFPAYAAEKAETRASVYFTRTSVYLYKLTANSIEIWFEAAGTGIMDEIGAYKVEVQQSTDSANWTTVKVYTKDRYTYMTDFNTGIHIDYVTYVGVRGYYYRAIITLYARDSSGSGYLFEYTETMKL